MANEFKVKNGLIVVGDTAISGAATIGGNSVIHTGNIGSYAITSLSDTLDSVTGRGSSTSNTITVGGLIVDTNTLYVDSSNNRLGIGTTSPASKLTVYDGDITIIRTTVANANFGGPVIKLGETTSEVGMAGGISFTEALSTSPEAVTMGIYYDGKANKFHITGSSNAQATTGENLIAATKHFTITRDAGNVGIGTTSPAQKLDVSGNAQITGQFAQGVSVVDKIANYGAEFRSSGASAQIFFGRSSSSVGSGAIGADANYVFSVWSVPSFSRLFVITQSGNVGIGTTSPASRLHVYNGASGATPYATGLTVENTGRVSLNLLSATANDSYVFFGNPSAGNAGYVGYENTANRLVLRSSDYISFLDSTGEAVRIDNGNVGIGTTAPGAKLDIVSTGAGSEGLRVDGASGGFAFVVRGGTDYTSHIRAGATIGVNYFTTPPSNGLIVEGNVGIGTTSPDTKLQVASAGSVGLSARSNTTGDSYLRLYLDSAIEADFFISRANSAVNLRTIQAKPLVLSTNSSEAMRIDSNGNVGIGTTNPTTKLYVDAGESTFNRGNSDGAIARFRGKNAEKAVIGTVDSWFAGNLGIGTTSPQTVLHVGSTGTNAYSSTITSGSNMKGIKTTLSNNADDMVGIYFATGTNTQGTHWSGITGSRSQSATDWSTQLNFYTHDENLSNINDATQKMVIKGSGNVGIGTTSPAKKLHVVGGDSDGIRVSGGTNNRYVEVTSTNIDFYTTSVSGYGMANLVRKNSDGSVLGQISGAFGDPNTLTYTYYGGTAYNNAAMYILSSNNYVGIGTSSPVQKLSVFGNIYQRTGDFITWNNGDAQIGAVSGYNLAFSTYDGVSAMLERMRITSAGNVGIGTTSPQSKLHIETSASNPFRMVRGTTNFGFELGGGAIGLYDYEDSIYRWYVDSIGNVGIGTSSPDQKLTVIGNIRLPQNNYIYFDNTAHYIRRGSNDVEIQGFNGLQLRTNNATRLYINQSGNVGIGTSAPPIRLYVGTVLTGTNGNGTYASDAIAVNSSESITIGPDRRADWGQDATTATSTTFQSKLNIWSDNEDHITFGGASTHLVSAWESFKIWINNDSSDTGTFHLYHTSSKTEFARFTGSGNNWINGGNVGIGTTTPGTKLDVNGVITATGGNSTNWNTAYSWGNHTTQGYATQTYVNTAVSNLVDSAPGTLDTLNELAAALGDDPNFATTVTNSIATKLPLAGGTMTGTINTNSNINFSADSTGIEFYSVNSLKKVLGRGMVLEVDASRAPNSYLEILQSGTYYFFWNSNHFSITDVSNWNTAYSWGDHAGLYLPITGGTVGGAVTINGPLVVNGTITENSSAKIKENVETSEGNLEKVVNLRPVTYNKIGSQNTELGLIAEEVANVYPEFVQYDENGEPVGVHYSRLTAALIGAVKELNEQLQELKRNK